MIWNGGIALDASGRALELLHLLRSCGHYLHHHWGHGRVSQSRTLRILDEYGEVTQRQLQDLMGIQQGSLSEVVKKLEGQGLIVRERGLSDQRQVLIRVTEKGKEQNRLDRESRTRQSVELVSVLDEGEQRQLMALLDKLLASWKAREGNAEDEKEGGPK